MADAFTALIGAIMMIGYMLLIAAKLAALPLWICTIVGLALGLLGRRLAAEPPALQEINRSAF